MKKFYSFAASLIVIASVLIISKPAMAGFTETLPQGAFMLEESFSYSWLSKSWDNSGDKVPLIEEIDRYEPGGGAQGVLRPEPKAKFYVLITKLQYGILDDLSVGIGIPVVLKTSVDPNLIWEPGDYQRQLGRPYSEEDFWAWAGSMGQSKPEYWSGNKGKISDIVLGLRFRWTHRIPGIKKTGLSSSFSFTGVIPTGSNADPEQVVSAGTSLWDMHSSGDLAFHLSLDKTFKKSLKGHLALGLDFFYETFLSRTLTSPTGSSTVRRVRLIS